MSSKTIKLINDLIVVAKLPNGDEYYLLYHDKGISITTTRNSIEKTVVVERFSENAIVVKLK
jgi:hypothetical protein